MPAKMHKTDVSDSEIRGLAELVMPMLEARRELARAGVVDVGRPLNKHELVEQEQEKAEARKHLEQATADFKAEVIDQLVNAYEAGRQDAVSDEAHRAINIRGYVLVGVVAAVVSMPLIAMLLRLDPDTFGAFIAPVTGIAGTVVGYWFGTVGQVPGQSTTQRRTKAGRENE
jgi:hypothetical protein